MNYEPLVAMCGATFRPASYTSRPSTDQQVANTIKCLSISQKNCDSGTLVCDNEDQFLFPGQAIRVNGDECVYLRPYMAMTRRGALIELMPSHTIEASSAMLAPTESMITKISTGIFDPGWDAECEAAVNASETVAVGMFIVPVRNTGSHSYPLDQACVVREVSDRTIRCISPLGVLGNYIRRSEVIAATPEQVTKFVNRTPFYKAA